MSTFAPAQPQTTAAAGSRPPSRLVSTSSRAASSSRRSRSACLLWRPLPRQIALADRAAAPLLPGAPPTAARSFFALFPAIYHLTSTPSTIALATSAVLASFLSPADPSDPTSAADCQYLELRTTPRADARTGLTREAYLDVVLSTLDAFNVDARARELASATAAGRAVQPGFGEARLIVSLDYRMDGPTVTSILALATSLRAAGRPIVGLDVCGDPSSPPEPFLLDSLREAKAAGWQLTIHVAELEAHDRRASAALLALGPRRIGHGTFLDAEARRVVQDRGIVVEVCLTSNVLCVLLVGRFILVRTFTRLTPRRPSAFLARRRCKTTATTADSHLHHYLAAGHPATICVRLSPACRPAAPSPHTDFPNFTLPADARPK